MREKLCLVMVCAHVVSTQLTVGAFDRSNRRRLLRQDHRGRYQSNADWCHKYGPQGTVVSTLLESKSAPLIQQFFCGVYTINVLAQENAYASAAVLLYTDSAHHASALLHALGSGG
jgi:hypothetical protein